MTATRLCLLLSLCSFPLIAHPEPQSTLQKRWLFVWRNLNDPGEVDRMLERFPRAAAAGYNGVVLQAGIPAAKAAEIKRAAETNHLDLIAIVMHGVKDRNYVEGVFASNTSFVVQQGKVVHRQDNPTAVLDGGFEQARTNRFLSWPMQDDPGVISFADDHVAHTGKISLRMENIGRNEHQH